jgi:hypothetical protein
MSEEIFKPIFGNNWQSLSPVMQKHYANHPFSNDISIAEGKMEINFGKIFRFFSPLFRILGMLAPYQGKDIFTRVKFRSEINSNALCLDREFHFSDKKIVRFFSRMTPIKNNEVVEIMACRIGWRCAFSYENGKVYLKHRGYNFVIFGFFIPLPITFLVGEGSAFEESLSEDEFRMRMVIKHFLFGEIYEYKGHFKIIKNT